MLDYDRAREAMVSRQIAGRGIDRPRVLDAMRKVRREVFVPAALKDFAYDDAPLPIGEGQTISQPYIVAAMIDAAAVSPNDRVLEIGAGSGYAAAVLGELAARVITMERVPALAERAQRALKKQGLTNVEVVTADGTLGWPDGAPYDVIIAAAGGPAVPKAWKEQLAEGGRLIMPVGSVPRRQRLKKLTRVARDHFVEEDLADVVFVPLIGAEGWLADESGPASPMSLSEPRSFKPAQPAPLGDLIREACEPLPERNPEGFAAAFDRYADRKVVLLGESTHGTAEFYRARAVITRRLIEKHGFNIVAVEADWPDAAMIDRYVRHRPAQPGSAPPFRRFPTWMWRNTEVEAFTEWLREHNEAVASDKRAGFYGLDLYNMSDSIHAVLDYLDRADPDAARAARERYGCLTPWQKDPAVYGRAVINKGYRQCEMDVVAQLKDLLGKQLEYAAHDGETFLDAAQNARLIASAERYYRVMYYGGPDSWNLRDTHMFETLVNILEARGAGAKAVVWAHNSHIGDASFTEMGIVRQELNLGQLCRSKFGNQAALIGFGTHTGTVAAAADWDGPMEVMDVRPGLEGSYEDYCHKAGVKRFLLDLAEGRHETVRQYLQEPRLERFIGVIYRPQTERLSHYVKCAMPGQFDSFVWLDKTSAVTPLPTRTRTEQVPETWPFGL